MFTIYTNHPGGNLVVVGERPATMYIEQIKKGKRIASSQITAHVFRGPPKRNVANHLIF